MTASRPSRVARATSARGGWLLVAFVVTVAFLARLIPVLRGGGLDGVYGYDDGVYYTAAASLLAGRLPYAQFTLLHPPGIVLVLVPFAALGRLTSDHVGLSVARLGFIVLGAVNAGLVTVLGARLARSIGASVATAAVGGVFYALWYSSIYSTRTTLLEGLGSLALLVALVLVWRDGALAPRAAVLAGAALAFGACTKIWGVVPGVVVTAWVWHRFGRRSAARLIAGGVVLAVLVCGPFLALAPAAMPRMVLLDQADRSRTTRSPVARALDASSLHWNVPALQGAAAVAVLALLLLVVVLASVVAWRSRAALPVLLLAATAATLVASPTYFTHYGELVAPPLALVLSGAAAGWAMRERGSVWLSTAVPLAVLVLLELPTQLHPLGSPADTVGVRAAIRGARCVATETPSMLASTDALTRGLDAGCQVPVDLTGVVYGPMQQRLPDGRSTPRLRNARLQQYLATYFMDADAQVFTHDVRTVLDRRGLRRLRGNRLVYRDGYVRVYRRG